MEKPLFDPMTDELPSAANPESLNPVDPTEQVRIILETLAPYEGQPIGDLLSWIIPGSTEGAIAKVPHPDHTDVVILLARARYKADGTGVEILPGNESDPNSQRTILAFTLEEWEAWKAGAMNREFDLGAQIEQPPTPQPKTTPIPRNEPGPKGVSYYADADGNLVIDRPSG